jgi:uncharacterized membrane-anchored protein YitT (DUF2179 family)
MEPKNKLPLYLIGLFSFPLYVVFNSFLFSALLLLFEKELRIILFGFVCEVPNNSFNFNFYTLFLIINLVLFLAGFIFIKRKKIILSSIIFIVILFDAMRVIFYGVDQLFGSFTRFIFYASTPLYKASFLFGLSYVAIPIFVLAAAVLYIYYSCRVFPGEMD